MHIPYGHLHGQVRLKAPGLADFVGLFKGVDYVCAALGRVMYSAPEVCA